MGAADEPGRPAGAKTRGRMRSLDAIRGLAALGVVLWHYQHLKPTSYPYSDVLLLFYKEGWRLVDLFFALSGFVFFMNYEDAIAEGRVGFKRFFVLRVSRLYPLHVVSMCIVLVLQACLHAQTGAFKIYGQNDLAHFMLNLGLLQYTGLEKTFSFNGPSWSISMEFFLYLTFFAFCLASRRWRNVLIAVLAFTGAKLIHHQVDTFVPLVNQQFGRAIVAFYLGGAAWRLHCWLPAHPRWRWPLIGACLAYVGVSVALVWLAEAGNPTAQVYSGDVTVISTVMFFAVVLLAAELPFLGRIRPFSFLGDISYSVYLLHVPVQLALYLYVAYGHPVDFSHPSAFWTFFAILLVVSTLSYRLLERPAMAAIRRAALQPRAGVEAGVGLAS